MKTANQQNVGQIGEHSFIPNPHATSESVRAIEVKNQELKELLGEVLATLEINYSRKSLTVIPEGQEQFEKLLVAWRERQRKIK